METSRVHFTIFSVHFIHSRVQFSIGQRIRMVVVEEHSRMGVGVEEERRSHMEVGVEEVGCHSRMVMKVEQLGQLVRLVVQMLVAQLAVVELKLKERSIHLFEHMGRLAAKLGLGLEQELLGMVELLRRNKNK